MGECLRNVAGYSFECLDDAEMDEMVGRDASQRALLGCDPRKLCDAFQARGVVLESSRRDMVTRRNGLWLCGAMEPARAGALRS
jgi:hypothetical protein